MSLVVIIQVEHGVLRPELIASLVDSMVCMLYKWRDAPAWPALDYFLVVGCLPLHDIFPGFKTKQPSTLLNLQ